MARATKVLGMQRAKVKETSSPHGTMEGTATATHGTKATTTAASKEKATKAEKGRQTTKAKVRLKVVSNAAQWSTMREIAKFDKLRNTTSLETSITAVGNPIHCTQLPLEMSTSCFSSVQPQLNFDLTASGDFSVLHVNMVSETCCSDSDMSWEQLGTSNFHDTLLCSADLSDLSSAMSLSPCSIDRSCYSERSSSEYFLEEDDQQSCALRFALHELLNIDDGVRYLDCVFTEHGFETMRLQCNHLRNA